MKARFYINEEEINEPNNYQELSIDLNFDKDDPTAQVSVNEWEIGTGRKIGVDGAVLSNSHISDGLSGGVGVLEGIPFRIDVSSQGVTYQLFNGFLDLSNATIACDKITAKAIEAKGIDWINEVADSFSFEYLAKGLSTGQAGKINTSDYTLVPYVVSSVPNYRDAALATVTSFVVINTIKDSVQALIEYTAALPAVLSFGNVFSIILRVAYIVVLVATAIKMIIDMFNLIIQPVKYHAGMKARILCDRAAEYLGLTFESSILKGDYIDMLILPQKFSQQIDADGILGFLKKDKTEQEGYYKGTFGDLLRLLKDKFNAKIIIDGTTIRLERVDYNISSANFQLPDLEINSHRLNANEFLSNYVIDYATDINDKNTIQQYTGTSIQVQTLPVVVQNRGMVLTRGLRQVNISLALGKRKTDLTIPENIFSALFKAFDLAAGLAVTAVNVIISVVNAIIKVVNGIIKALKFIGIRIKAKLIPLKKINLPNLGNLIENRIDMMLMENDFISVPKVLMIGDNADARNNKLLSTNDTLLNAEYLWDNYHSINSFDSQAYSTNNQRKIYSADGIPFCFTDYEKVRANNKIINSNGIQVGTIDSLKWNIYDQEASIDFRIEEVYTNNLRTEKIIPNGK